MSRTVKRNGPSRASPSGRATMIAVSGIGLGYHLDCLKRRFPGRPLIAIEHDPEVADLARKTCPQHLEGVTVVFSGADLSPVFEADRHGRVPRHRPLRAPAVVSASQGFLRCRLPGYEPVRDIEDQRPPDALRVRGAMGREHTRQCRAPF